MGEMDLLRLNPSIPAFYSPSKISPGLWSRWLAKFKGAFFWKGDPDTKEGAKLRRDTVCLPKQFDGLGIGRLDL